MSGINNIFDVAGRAMGAQMVRMNTVATNLANTGSTAMSEAEAFRPIRPVFQVEYSDAFTRSGLSSVSVDEIVQLDRPPVREYRPDHPYADQDGFIFRSSVNAEEELVEMMDASRQYQNMVEVTSTLRTLMARTLSMGQ